MKFNELYFIVCIFFHCVKKISIKCHSYENPMIQMKKIRMRKTQRGFVMVTVVYVRALLSRVMFRMLLSAVYRFIGRF